jgi:hypothetical protein
MPPRKGTLATPTGDITSRKALSDKGSRCVNDVNVVYQTVYKHQNTPSRDNRRSVVAELPEKIEKPKDSPLASFQIGGSHKLEIPALTH